MPHTRLDLFKNPEYNPGAAWPKRIFWFYVNACIFKTSLLPSSSFKTFLLRVFGARVGKGVVIKPCVNIKYPWKLRIGDHCWIGEEVWIDNLDEVTLHNHVCISQGAFLLCGNHNYKKTGFDLVTAPITLESGAWAGAKTVICPGVIMHTESVLTAGSVATKSLDAFGIYGGNPAVKLRDRLIEEA
ncbi:MAG: WcaF family extracellular polysaccharide biosynthesis acetyltransferase [Bacteroidota bacterium]|jgi:putative colanic acid biosynthesis acetyltransferase WcaF